MGRIFSKNILLLSTSVCANMNLIDCIILRTVQCSKQLLWISLLWFVKTFIFKKIKTQLHCKSLFSSCRMSAYQHPNLHSFIKRFQSKRKLFFFSKINLFQNCIMVNYHAYFIEPFFLFLFWAIFLQNMMLVKISKKVQTRKKKKMFKIWYQGSVGTETEEDVSLLSQHFFLIGLQRALTWRKVWNKTEQFSWELFLDDVVTVIWLLNPDHTTSNNIPTS